MEYLDLKTMKAGEVSAEVVLPLDQIKIKRQQPIAHSRMFAKGKVFALANSLINIAL